MTDWASLLQDDAVVVFLFHGVIARQRHAVRNYTRKHLEAQTFRAVLARLCSAGTPVSMTQVVDCLAGQTPFPRRAFAVTFDDGFRNNAICAAPILRDLRVPATFYLTTDFVDLDADSWIDSIERAVEASECCRIESRTLGLSAACANSAERIALLEEIRRTVKSSRTLDPYEVAAEIVSQLQIGTRARDEELDRKMNWDDVRELDRDPLFTIGGHGRTHRILEFLDDDALAREIDGSLERLRSALGRTVSHYSYPEGLAHCYSARVSGALRQRGVVCAPSAEPGVNTLGADPFTLKRIPVV